MAGLEGSLEWDGMLRQYRNRLQERVSDRVIERRGDYRAGFYCVVELLNINYVWIRVMSWVLLNNVYLCS